MNILVLNAGSSTLKFRLLALRDADDDRPQVLVDGLVDKWGTPEAGLKLAIAGEKPTHQSVAAESPADAAAHAIRVCGPHGIEAIGHRVVHGGPDFSDPVIIDDAAVEEIRDLIPLAPLHNPGAVAGIEAARARFAVPHVAVFDTAFFTTLPESASTYAIPRDLAQKYRIRRYGFHGTSHQFVSRAGAELVGRDLSELNQIVLHLGNGCSASAVRGGAAVEASMGLTPLQGLVMGTRSGDVDPGLHTFLHNELGLSVGDIDTLLNKQSGLKGMAGVNDFRGLEQRRAAGDESAQLAFEVYVHRLKHYVGAYLAILGRLDLLTFTAGVGENNPALRAAVVEGLDGLGFAVDAELNAAPSRVARIISPDGPPIKVAVIPTNEELAIAREAAALLGAHTDD